MKTAIIYATTEGQTRKICQFLADRLVDLGVSVELLDVDDAAGTPLDRFDQVILAASIHAGGYQKSISRFVSQNVSAINNRMPVFLSVSLSAAGTDEEDWKGVHRILEAFLAETGLQPDRVEHVAGAFRFSEYDFLKTLAMRWIAHQKGEDIPRGEDREYTDWAQLEELATQLSGA